MDKNIEINIEELVLSGFSFEDRHSISKALEHELVRLLSQPGEPGLLTKSVQKAGLDAGRFNVTTNAKPESIGIQTAQTIYNSFTT